MAFRKTIPILFFLALSTPSYAPQRDENLWDDFFRIQELFRQPRSNLNELELDAETIRFVGVREDDSRSTIIRKFIDAAKRAPEAIDRLNVDPFHFLYVLNEFKPEDVKSVATAADVESFLKMQQTPMGRLLASAGAMGLLILNPSDKSIRKEMAIYSIRESFFSENRTTPNSILESAINQITASDAAIDRFLEHQRKLVTDEIARREYSKRTVSEIVSGRLKEIVMRANKSQQQIKELQSALALVREIGTSDRQLIQRFAELLSFPKTRNDLDSNEVKFLAARALYSNISNAPEAIKTVRATPKTFFSGSFGSSRTSVDSADIYHGAAKWSPLAIRYLVEDFESTNLLTVRKAHDVLSELLSRESIDILGTENVNRIKKALARSWVLEQTLYPNDQYEAMVMQVRRHKPLAQIFPASIPEDLSIDPEALAKWLRLNPTVDERAATALIDRFARVPLAAEMRSRQSEFAPSIGILIDRLLGQTNYETDDPALVRNITELALKYGVRTPLMERALAKAPRTVSEEFRREVDFYGITGTASRPYVFEALEKWASEGRLDSEALAELAKLKKGTVPKKAANLILQIESIPPEPSKSKPSLWGRLGTFCGETISLLRKLKE
jgi:hypothetical protein